MIGILLISIPFLCALLLLLVKKELAKKIALIASIPNFIISCVAIYLYNQSPSCDLLYVDYPWISDLGIHFKLGIDGISLVMILLTNLLTPLIILSTFQASIIKPISFYSLILIMHAALNGVFLALDGFLYYVCWELALIPIYFILLRWSNGENKEKVTLKFFLYTLLGSLFMLAGIIILYLKTNSESFDINLFYSIPLSPILQKVIFLLFFVAYAVKIPIFPFHSWQPQTYTQAPTAGTMLLAGIMLKMGLYSVIRWMVPIVPMAISEWGNYILILCIIGVIYGGIIAINQKNIKTLFAYSSLSHVGLIAAGIFSMTLQGLQGSMIQMLSHGINVIGLFFVADIVASRTGTYEIANLGGLRKKNPFLATCFFIIILGSIGLPLTNGFVGEFLLLSGIYQYSIWMAAIAGLTIIFGAVYLLRLYQKSFLGEITSYTQHFPELHWNEKIILIIISLLVMIIGIYPTFLLDLSKDSIQQIIIQANQHISH